MSEEVSYRLEKSNDGATGAEHLDEVGLLQLVHRHDNFVTFEQGDSFKKALAVRPAEFGTMLPTIAEQLIKDAYYSINGLWKKHRNAALVSRFTSCFADVDLHDDPAIGTPAFDVTVEKVIARAITLAAEGEIPQPSIIVRSGRGFWLFWLLQESTESEQAVPCSASTRPIWTRMQRAIADRLAKCGIDADRAAQSPERLTRYPNSINTRAGKRVGYTVNFDAHTRAPMFYTLSEIAAKLGIEEQPSAFIRLLPAVDRICTQAHAPTGRSASKRANGWRALRDRRLRDYQMLLELRGGFFQKGLRNHAALLLALLYRGDQRQADRVWQFGTKHCTPPLTPTEITKALKTVGKGRRFKIFDRRIGDWLRIAPAENDRLEAEYLAEPNPNREAPRKIRAARRREVISELCSVRVPTLRDIQSRLESLGLGCTIEIVRRDLVVVGIVNPRLRTNPRQLVLPAPKSATDGVE
jgi:hypothetical protein